MEIEFNGYYQKNIYFKSIRWIYRPTSKELLLRVGAFVIFTLLYVANIVIAFQEQGIRVSDQAIERGLKLLGN